ncbi:MAG: hypothetical protein ACLUDU_07735 [Butyricimonas faecihominis]
MMKYGVLLILVVMVVSVCYSQLYAFIRVPEKFGFHDGKWLVTNVETQLPPHVQGGIDT